MSKIGREDDSDDPWLTLAEIAEELRVNPATVRLWISRGRLKAMRAGQRKLLVRRSELDRMLVASDPAKQPEPREPRKPEPLRPVFDRPLAGQVARARANMDPTVIPAAIKRIQEAEAVFDTAVSASNNAPPDPGFPSRLRAVAAACLQRADPRVPSPGRPLPLPQSRPGAPHYAGHQPHGWRCNSRFARRHP